MPLLIFSSAHSTSCCSHLPQLKSLALLWDAVTLAETALKARSGVCTPLYSLHQQYWTHNCSSSLEPCPKRELGCILPLDGPDGPETAPTLSAGFWAQSHFSTHFIMNGHLPVFRQYGGSSPSSTDHYHRKNPRELSCHLWVRGCDKCQWSTQECQNVSGTATMMWSFTMCTMFTTLKSTFFNIFH